MSQTINRMYDSFESANRAANELRTHRFDRFDEVFVVTLQGGDGAQSLGPDASTDDIVAALMKAFVLKAQAKVFADGIRRGGTLVTVHAAFGTAAEAVTVLERHGPIDSGVPEPSYPSLAWDDAAPLSSALRIPVLLSDSDTFSRFWNVPPLLKSGATTSSALGLSEIVDTSAPFSGTTGVKLISDQPTFLSSKLGLPVLTKPRAD